MSSRGDGKRRCVNLRSDLDDWVHYGGERSLMFPNNRKSQGLVEGEKRGRRRRDATETHEQLRVQHFSLEMTLRRPTLWVQKEHIW